ncbi:hypothetical protein RISK_001180 [Rhodopirellula islandica]|uniref:Uncharacterized protein n=1 Tax=Rhodopirellula islandica TaxID=595434 RepID=A0A0J1BJY3_RHOIS|nr:hypothetical protein RISK_001180 [Rhodopirellula islandica]
MCCSIEETPAPLFSRSNRASTSQPQDWFGCVKPTSRLPNE